MDDIRKIGDPDVDFAGEILCKSAGREGTCEKRRQYQEKKRCIVFLAITKPPGLLQAGSNKVFWM